MSSADRANTAAAMSCLDDPTRRAVYEFIRTRGGALSRTETADALGLPRSTASFHLDKLAADGLATVEFKHLGTRAGPGSGRPAKLYRAVATEISFSIPPRRYDLAAELMAEAIERSSATGAAIDDSLHVVARSAGQVHAREAGGIRELLEDAGYEPHDDSGGFTLGNCPFHRLAADHAETVCSLNRAFLEGALEGADDDAHEVTAETLGAPCCARIISVGPPD
jgi:predicted ArsR family transcriptional regulator